MLNLFHPVSRALLESPAPKRSVRRQMDNEINRLKHIGEAVAELSQLRRMTNDELRLNRLTEIQERRWLVWMRPENEWNIYELCKTVYELAEVDRVDFNGAELPKKIELIRAIAPFADPHALREGVIEYHESRRAQRWGMEYLQELVHEQANRL